MKRLLIPALVLLLLFQSTGALAVGPSAWPIYLWNNGRDNAVRDNVVFGTTPVHLGDAWSYEIHQPVVASPATANFAAFIPSWDGYLYSLNLALHRVNWRTFLGTRLTATGTRGISSPPVFDPAIGTQGAVLVGGGGPFLASDPHLYLFALDERTGAVLWQARVGTASKVSIVDSPLVVNNRVYVATASARAGTAASSPKAAGTVYAIDAPTGVILARQSLATPLKKGGEVTGSMSANSTGTRLYVPTGPGQDARKQKLTYGVVALDAQTLKVVGHWQAPAKQAIGTNGFGTSVTVFASGSKSLLGAGMRSGMYYALNAARLKRGPVWKRRLGNTQRSSHPIDDSVSAAYAAGSDYPGGSTLFVAAPNASAAGSGSSGRLYALAPANGHVIWSVPLAGQPRTGAVTVYDDVAIVPVQNDASTGASGGSIEVHAVSDGRLLGSMATSGTPSSAVTVIYGNLFFVTRDGMVHNVRLSH